MSDTRTGDSMPSPTPSLPAPIRATDRERANELARHTTSKRRIQKLGEDFAAPPRATMTEKDLAEVRNLLDLPELNSDARPAILALLAEVARLRAPLAAHPATTPEPMIWTLLEAAYAERDAGSRGRYPAQIALERAITALMTKRKQAAPPSRESGALLDSYVAEMTRLTRDLSQVETVRAARAALDRRLSTLERDAARMREALEGVSFVAEDFVDTDLAHNDPERAVRIMGEMLRAPTTETPDNG